MLDIASLGVGGTSKLVSAGLNGGANSVIWMAEGAAKFAATIGKPIGSTPVGKLLNALLEAGIPANDAIIVQAPKIYASNAKGVVQVVVTLRERRRLKVHSNQG